MTTQNSSGCNCDCGPKGYIPLNSKIMVNKNNTINIQTPSGWVYIGVDSSTRSLVMIGNGTTSVSCTCTGSGSCYPFIATGLSGSTSGCAGDCTSCQMTQTGVFQGTTHIFSSGGYIDFTQGVNFAKKGVHLPAVFASMFNVKEVAEALNNFLEKVYEGKPYPVMIQGENFITAPDGYEMAVVNVFGRATIIPVPNGSGTGDLIAGGTASCSCTQGGCTVKSHSIPFIGSATWCEGDCSGTCTLGCTTASGNGVVETVYAAQSFQF